MTADPNINKGPEEQGSPPEQLKPAVLEIPVEKIKVSDLCRRSDSEQDLDSLAKSISRRGLIHWPVVLENDDGSYTLIAGARRFLACKTLGWKTIPCHVKRIDKQEAGFLSFSENAVRLKPHPVDQAKALQQIKELTGKTHEQIADEVGLPQSGVTERLGILHLPKDILSKIDPRPESPFKLTHAVILSQLMQTSRFDEQGEVQELSTQTSRFNRQVEVQQLCNKTVEHTLSSSELRSLVQLLKDGDYDCLPDSLRDPFMKNKHMTANMAKLYLYPQNIVDGQGKQAELLRKRASDLEKAKIEKLILKALRREWSDVEIKKRLLKLIEDSYPDQESEDNNQSESAAMSLFSDISSLISRLQHSHYQLPCLVESNPGELVRVRNAVSQLVNELERFFKAIDKVVADTNHSVGN